MDSVFNIKGGDTLTIGDFQLCCTCSTHPEQYELIVGNEVVGHLHFKWGALSATTANTNEIVYHADIVKPGYDWSNEQRMHYLKAAVAAKRR